MRAAPDPEDLADSRGWLDKPRLRQEDETLRNMHLMLPDGDLPAAVFRGLPPALIEIWPAPGGHQLEPR